jgi:hypothetical protein
MKLFSYIVARDFGFAPNPFHGVCTLATCKPKIRRKAQVDDWVMGTGSKKYGLEGRIVFAMRVDEILNFDEYWNDKRFKNKRPNLHGSLKQAFGDNIYHRDERTGEWIQDDSHHSFVDGLPNEVNIFRDTQTTAVLIAREFYYWGGFGPPIPKMFRGFQGWDVCHTRPGHKCNFPTKLVDAMIKWIRGKGESGYIDEPLCFRTFQPRARH